MPSINERLCCSVVSVRNFTHKSNAFRDISKADSFQYCTIPHFWYICMCESERGGRETERERKGERDIIKY